MAQPRQQDFQIIGDEPAGQKLSKAKRRRRAAIMPELDTPPELNGGVQKKSIEAELEAAFPCDADYPDKWVVFDKDLGVISRSEQLAKLKREKELEAKGPVKAQNGINGGKSVPKSHENGNGVNISSKAGSSKS